MHVAVSHLPDHEHGLDLEAALDFLNTHDLDDGVIVEHLAVPDDAARWFVEHDVLHPPDATGWSSDDLDRVKAVRDALREVVDSVASDRPPRPEAVALVNGALGAGPAPTVELGPAGVRIGHRHAASPVDDALAALAAPIVIELGEGRPERFRICANDRCRWTFFDTSPTGRRRWCDMKTCGNRAKAARHRARTKSDQLADVPEIAFDPPAATTPAD